MMLLLRLWQTRLSVNSRDITSILVRDSHSLALEWWTDWPLRGQYSLPLEQDPDPGRLTV
jgi:hypothetical protein